MKYDASMTEFHGDIVAAVKLMCGKDTVARSNSEGASPAPLRDYLKNRYGYNGKCSNGAMYQNTPSKGMEIKLDREADNNGDNFIILSWSQVAKFIRDNPSEIFEEEGKSAEPPAPAQTETAVVFDYSELDTDTAEQLGKISENVINIKKKYIFDMAEQVKKAHDLLANCKNGLFGAWCESVGISRRTGEMLNNIAKQFRNISSEQQENLNKLTDGNVKLLYEAARPSAPAELVEAVKNGDITTHKEYIELKKELERTKETAKNQSLTIDDLLKQQSELVKQNSGMNLELSNANKKIEELESRPVEVAVEQDTAALAEKDKQISELKERIERLSDNSVKSFVIKLTIEEYVQLQDIVKSSDNHCIVNAVNSARMIKL